ncbi:MAG TPA: VOC family protein [Pyrinomonadaceae bacterium]|jgi:hypothetical protein|nr:VOC family protein [Pyrinomonadaceae bacterium]
MAQPEVAGPFPEHGQFCWTEIASTDLKKATSFYSNVFGWNVDPSTSGAGGFAYLEFSSSGGANPDGAIYEMNPDWFGGNPPPAHIAVYVSVDDVDASAEKAVSIGGTILRPPSDIPNVGRMCVIRDPTGAAISLFTPLKS